MPPRSPRKSIISEEDAETELERIATEGGHATFRAIVGWLRANREAVREDLTGIRQTVEDTQKKVGLINGNVARVQSEVNELQVQSRVNRALIDARKEWDGQQTETRRFRTDALIAIVCAGLVALATLVGLIGHAAGAW